MSVTDMLSKFRVLLTRTDEECTFKAGEARRLLAEVDAYLADLHTGRTSETAIDIGSVAERISLHMKSMNTNLRPCKRSAKFLIRRVRNHQLGENGEPRTLEKSGDAGVTFWDLETKEAISEIENVRVPERVTLEQKLWAFPVKGGRVGHFILSDTSDKGIAKTATLQFAPPLSNSPKSGCEEVAVDSMSIQEFKELLKAKASSRDLLELRQKGVELEDFGLTSRSLRDIDIASDPGLSFLTQEAAEALSSGLSLAGLDKELQLQAVRAAGIWSTSLGPHPNPSYSDFKRITFSDGTVVVNMPLICYGDVGSQVPGIPKRDPNGPANLDNRLNDGTCYIADMGGIDPVIRKGKPNPLPPHRFAADGPDFAFSGQGALMRYKGGKCLAVNNTTSEKVISTRWFDHKVQDVTVKPLTAIWKLDFGSFTFDESGVPGVDPTRKGGSSGYYTVFAASRPPASGFMGVPLAPIFHKFGRGRDVVASGVTMANGISATGVPFKNQDSVGQMLDSSGQVTNDLAAAESSTLKGLTGSNNGHGMDLTVLLEELEKRGKVKGADYLTIPSNATAGSGTVQDVLIPAGKTVPRITNAVATLTQFANGVFISNGGPASFQPGISPFLAGVPAYTPQWHINFLFFNCGGTASGSNSFQPAKSNKFEDWALKGRNPSLSGPGPVPVSSTDPNATTISSQLSSIGYNPADPDTFDPVQMANGLKGRHCPDYVCTAFDTAVENMVPVSEIPKEEEANENNTIFVTEAPAGARQGWVKFLIVNCPLPLVVDFETEFRDDEETVEILSS